MPKALHAGFFVALILSALAAASGASPEDAEALIRDGHWKRARALVEPEIKAHPDDPRFSYLMAEIKAAFQDFQGALPLAQLAADLEPKNSDYHLKLGQVYGELAARASMFAAGSLAGKFRKEVETARELNPKNLAALDSMMQFKYQAPGLMGGDKHTARAMADEILRLNPLQGYLAHAELAELEKNPAEVEANYKKAVGADPKSYDAETLLAKYYASSDESKLGLAIPPAQQALGSDPARGQAYGILARVYALQHRWDDLQSLLSKADTNAPEDLVAYYDAALALLVSGQELSRAEAYARKYLTQESEGEEPDAADGHRVLALIFDMEGRTADAQAEIQKALQLRPNFRAAKEDAKRLGKR